MASGEMGFIDRMRSSDLRARIATVGGVLGLVVTMALLTVDPASAGSGGQSAAGVQPTEISYGGGSGACDASFPGLPSAAQHELWINNPVDGTFVGPDGTEVIIDVYEDDTKFTFTIDAPDVAAYDVVVNGGAKNTHFDYDNGPGPISTDTDLHAPTKGGSPNLYKLSHINICYDDFAPNVSGVKFHDRDTDGALDSTEEEGLSGWTISVFDSNGTEVRQTTTGSDGSYEIGGLPVGTYTVCEATNSAGLPANGTLYTWFWAQSAPAANTLCAEMTGYEPAGYSVSGGVTLTENRDFGNHIQVEIDCSGPDPVVVTLGGSGQADNPEATVTVPGNCASGSFTSTFDLGRSADVDEWAQFVIFDGDPDGAEIIDLEIEWDSEMANYVDGDLVVPTTKVVFDGVTPLPDPLPDAVLCNSQAGLPNSTTSTCLFSRTIAEGGSVPAGDIQITELFKFLGDPKGFR